MRRPRPEPAAWPAHAHADADADAPAAASWPAGACSWRAVRSERAAEGVVPGWQALPAVRQARVPLPAVRRTMFTLTVYADFLFMKQLCCKLSRSS